MTNAPVKQFSFKPLGGGFSAAGSGKAPNEASVVDEQEEVVRTRKQLKQLEEKAQKTGVEEGIKKGQQERFDMDKKLAALLTAMATKIEEKTAALAAAIEEKNKGAVALAAAVGKKFGGEALSANPLPQMEECIRKCMPLIYDEKEVIVIVHNKWFEALQSKAEALAMEGSFKGKLVFKGSDTIPESDCRLEWHNGGGRFEMQALWKEIQHALGVTVPELGATSEPATSVKEPSSEEVKKPETVSEQPVENSAKPTGEEPK